MAPLPDKLELRDGEQVVAELSVSKKVTYGLLAVGGLTLLGALFSPAVVSLLIPGTAVGESIAGWLVFWILVAAGLGFVGLAFRQEVAHRYYLTNERLIVREGILVSQTMSVEYEEMGTVTYARDFLARTLNIGTIVINAGEHVYVRMVDDPRAWVGRITKFQEEFSKAVRADGEKRAEVEASTRRVIEEAKADPETGDTTVTSKVVRVVKEALQPAPSTAAPIDEQLLSTEVRTPKEIRESRSGASSAIRAAQKKLKGGV